LAVSCRRFHNEELHSLYASPEIIRVIKSRKIKEAGHAARIEEMRNMCIYFVVNPEGKRQVGRPGCRCEDNIRMDINGIGWELWIGLI